MKEELLTKLKKYKEKLTSLGRYLWLIKKESANKISWRRTKKRRFLAKHW